MNNSSAISHAKKTVKESEVTFEYINVFKNPNNLPINQIHLERVWFELKQDLPKDCDIFELSDKDLERKFSEKHVEVIPALDKRWLPKVVLSSFEPYVFSLTQEENAAFTTNNIQYLTSLDYLLNCNFHQFWCTVLYEPSAILCLRSFILNPIPWYQASYLDDAYIGVYLEVFNKFYQVFDRLLTFRASPSEFMPHEFGVASLTERKLLNLPVVITLALLYKNTQLKFVNKLTKVYFDDTSEIAFKIKEVELMIDQALVGLEMVGGQVCGFDEQAEIVAISIEPRPKLFSLPWVYSVVNYLLNTVATMHVLFQFYKPWVEVALKKNVPFRLPFIYVNVYRELYQLMSNREELEQQKELRDRIFEEIKFGRSEFLDVFHTFVSHCLDTALENIGYSRQQEDVVETYLKLLTTALESEYFICDYDAKFSVVNQNEILESCCQLDNTRTQFITSCLNKLPRHKKLEELSKCSSATIEDVFKLFKPFEQEKLETIEPEAGPSAASSNGPAEDATEVMIKDIADMFPHLGDGFILKCLEAYNYNSSDVINAILEENLPPHLYDIPFDEIRIPPEPEPEQPILAYRGKKPDYNDALALLNDKSDLMQLKTFVLEGVQYTNNYSYDDEYDDRYDDTVGFNVGDNVATEEAQTFNPNHQESDSSSEEEEQASSQVNGAQARSNDKSKLPFCEDPAVVRARREAAYKTRHQAQPRKNDVVGKAKGQGQEKSVVVNRQKKNVQKSSKANHNRKSGAQWKRNKGMFPS